MPDLLKANNEKKFYMKLLDQLVVFLDEEFSQDELFRQIVGANKLSIFNVSDIVQSMLADLKKKNKEENKKLR